eukprot:TRINITY_DN6130_c0_g1_i5.p1 TRINITY_DN6130_c0_g1~~TRINITY_DN6130_c0_g1_i5.p1  ORF type:complete len:601 (+),score=109.64 TRINITY_DN6130_c0_g1_i5:1933-3735(+)
MTPDNLQMRAMYAEMNTAPPDVVKQSTATKPEISFPEQSENLPVFRQQIERVVDLNMFQELMEALLDGDTKPFLKADQDSYGITASSIPHTASSLQPEQSKEQYLLARSLSALLFRDDDEVFATITHPEGDYESHRARILSLYGPYSQQAGHDRKGDSRKSVSMASNKGAGGASSRKNSTRRFSSMIPTGDLSILTRLIDEADAYSETDSRRISVAASEDAGIYGLSTPRGIMIDSIERTPHFPMGQDGRLLEEAHRQLQLSVPKLKDKLYQRRGSNSSSQDQPRSLLSRRMSKTKEQRAFMQGGIKEEDNGALSSLGNGGFDPFNQDRPLSANPGAKETARTQEKMGTILEQLGGILDRLGLTGSQKLATLKRVQNSTKSVESMETAAKSFARCLSLIEEREAALSSYREFEKSSSSIKDISAHIEKYEEESRQRAKLQHRLQIATFDLNQEMEYLRIYWNETLIYNGVPYEVKMAKDGSEMMLWVHKDPILSSEVNMDTFANRIRWLGDYKSIRRVVDGDVADGAFTSMTEMGKGLEGVLTTYKPKLHSHRHENLTKAPNLALVLKNMIPRKHSGLRNSLLVSKTTQSKSESPPSPLK